MADRIVPKADTVAQATQMVSAAQELLGHRFEDLASNPCRLLDTLPGIDFVVQPAADEGGCAVAGAYFGSDAGGPRIVVSDAVEGRRNFTALHEFGHHLQQTTEALIGNLWAHDDYALREELACDAFAAAVLLPAAVVENLIQAAGPTAADVSDLYRRTSASRAAVVVRAAEQLPAPGHVVLVDAAGRVVFSSSLSLPRLARDSDQMSVGPIERAIRNGHGHGRGRFSYRDGIVGAELYVDVSSMGNGYWVAVAVMDRAPWLTFSPTSRDSGPAGRTYECINASCGATYESFDAACQKCTVPRCRECDRCACAGYAEERLCPGCFVMQPATSFEGDLCPDCT